MRLATFILALALCASAAANVYGLETLRIAAGSEKGTYRLLASAIHDVLKGSDSNIALEIVTTDGSVENMALLRDEHPRSGAHLGLVQSDVFFDASREALETERLSQQDLPWHTILLLSREPIQVVVRPEVGGRSSSDGHTAERSIRQSTF